MTEHNDQKVRAILKQAFPPVTTELGRDLWPAVLRKLDAPSLAVPWYDWALLAVLGGTFVLFPKFILVFVYHL